MLEAALALGFLGTLCVGLLEYGYAWRQTAMVERAVQSGGRAAGNLANDSLADYEVLQSLRSGFGSTKNVTIDYVVVYRSGTANGAVPQDCKTASQNDLCNRYVVADLTRAATGFGCSGGEPDRFWCPTLRSRERTPSPDYVGVFVQARYTGITGMLPSPITIGRSAVYALEPCAFGLPNC